MSEHIKAGVIGHPIKHSKSPLIHNYWIEKYGFDGDYGTIDIAPENLKDGISQLIDAGYAGFNVTIPHKESIIEYCDEVSHNAQVIGAVNTVTIQDGKLHGQNTDGFGFIHNILGNTADFEFSGKRAVVLGAGGATRAIASALIGEEIEQIILHALNGLQQTAGCLQSAHAKRGIYFVDFSISCHAWMPFFHGLARCKTRCALVAGFGINLVELDHKRSS